MDRVDGLIAVVQILQDLLRAVGKGPSSWLKLGCYSIALQVPHPADHEVTVLPDEEGRAFPWSQVDHALLLLLAQQHLVEPGHPLGLDLVLQLCLKLDLALVTQFPGDQLARPVADAMGDIVAGDVEDAAVIEHAADDDVGVGMAGVVMVDRDPVEAGSEIQFHLAHEVTGEAAKVSHLGCILGRDDEAKLMTIFPAALHKRLAVGLVLERRIGLAPIAVTRNTIPFKVTQMGIDGPAHRPAHLRTPCAPRLRIEPDHPRLDHHPPRPEAACGISLPPTVPALPSKRGNDLRAPATRVEPACPSSFPAAARSRSRAYPSRIAARLADRDLDLLEERLRPRIDRGSTVARPTRSDPEILTLIPCHDATIDIGKSRHKSCRASIASNRINAHDGEQIAGLLLDAHCERHRSED